MAQTATPPAADDFDSTANRLYSLDALRGFDMFWIIGADEIFYSMKHATHGTSAFWNMLANQLTHPDWNGFHAYDLIFPLFLFMAGVSTPFSVGRELEKGKSRPQLVWRVVKRSSTSMQQKYGKWYGSGFLLLGIIYCSNLRRHRAFIPAI